jgi:hypothetical protein
MLAEHGAGAFAIEDLPDEQRRAVRQWSPSVGHLVFYGITGAGTTSALLTMAAAMSHNREEHELRLFAIDADSWRLSTLGDSPHCAMVVRSDDRQGVQQLCAEVADLLEARESTPADRRGERHDVVLMIDNLGGLLEGLDSPPGAGGLTALLTRLVTEGPRVGMHVVFTARHASAVPRDLAAVIRNELVMQLGDAQEYAGFGLRATEVPRFVPGRAVDPSNGVEVQIAAPPATNTQPQRPPAMLLDRHALYAASTTEGAAWRLAVGTDDITGLAVSASLGPGSTTSVRGADEVARHRILNVIAGNPHLVAAQVLVSVLTSAPHRWPNRQHIYPPAKATAFVNDLLSVEAPRLAIIDDAELLNDSLAAQLLADRDDLLVVIACTAGELVPAWLDGATVRIELDDDGSAGVVHHDSISVPFVGAGGSEP